MPKRVSWLWQLVRITNKGYAAFVAGVAPDQNPYKVSSNGGGHGGSVQGQRRRAWLEGWCLAEREKKEAEDNSNLKEIHEANRRQTSS